MRTRGRIGWLALTVVVTGLAGGQLPAEDPDAFAWFVPVVRPFTLSANGAVEEQAPVTVHGGGKFSSSSERAGATVQPWHGHDAFGDDDELLLSARGGTTTLDSSAPLPLSGPLPHRLTSVNAAATFRQVRPSGVIWGVNAGTGSASDRPFASSRDLSLNLTAFVDLPAARPHDAWLLFAGFSSDRSELNYLPLPGFAYLYQAPPRWRAMIGLPFDTVSWRPRDDVRFDAMAMVFGSAHVGASWYPAGAPPEGRPPDRLLPRVHLDYDWGGEGWKPHDRPQLRDQLFIRSERVTAGIALDNGHDTIDLYAGWAFHREVFEATSVFGNHHDRIDLQSGAVFGASVRGRF
jgi:hypothetical protein